MSAPTIVRRAGRSDVGALVDLMREFYVEASYSLDREWAEAAFSELFENPDRGCVWIAEAAGTAAGHAVLTVRYTMEHGSLSGYIDDLFVRPRFRRRGIARALVSELFVEGRRRGCRSVYVEVGAENTPAIRLYNQFGLRRFEDGRVLLGSVLRSIDT